jgi:hypothetical protein
MGRPGCVGANGPDQALIVGTGMPTVALALVLALIVAPQRDSAKQARRT